LTLPIALPNLTLSLSQLPRQSYQAELEFWFASRQVDSQRLDALICLQLLPNQARPALQRQQLDGMLKGFADLVFERQGRYYLIDYKSNHLGGDDAAYDGAALCDAILQHRYDIQACLYLLALQRLLKARLGEAYDYERHIGGAVFWFLRGIDGAAQGVQLLRPPQSLIDELDALFAGRELVNAG
jgi:exodeoxyribonuclease V beta subunit